VLEQVFIQCTVGGPVRVYVKDGVITRMRPMVFDDKVDAPSWDDIPQHRVKRDGYSWWPVRVHPSDARARGINDGDIVKLFNGRGTVLCAAYVTERVRPETVHSYEAAAKYDPLEPGVAGSPDRGGCVNPLSPSRIVSKKASGEAQNSCLVEIAKWAA
jgi:anaerobic selenocysteine-containing dehydrogenase